MNGSFLRRLLHRLTQAALVVSVLAMCVLLWLRQKESADHRERLRTLDQLLADEQQQLSYANELLTRAQQTLADVKLRKARLEMNRPATPPGKPAAP
jgi:signal transduction histidine kinase